MLAHSLIKVLILKSLYFPELDWFLCTFELPSSIGMLAPNGQKISAKQVALTSWFLNEIDFERFRGKVNLLKDCCVEVIEGSAQRIAFWNGKGQKNGENKPFALFWPNFLAFLGLFLIPEALAPWDHLAIEISRMVLEVWF